MEKAGLHVCLECFQPTSSHSVLASLYQMSCRVLYKTCCKVLLISC